MDRILWKAHVECYNSATDLWLIATDIRRAITVARKTALARHFAPDVQVTKIEKMAELDAGLEVE